MERIGRLGWLLLAPYAALLWLLRTRTFFLGDGTVWLTLLRTGERESYSEPLAGAIWSGWSALLRAIGAPRDPAVYGLLSVACGVLAAVLAVRIARDLVPAGPGRTTAMGLLLTLGTGALWCGYLESYPIAVVLLLAALSEAIRRAQGRGSAARLALWTGTAFAAHFLTLYLYPAYAIATWRRFRGAGRRIAALVLPFAIAAALLLAVGSRPAEWAGAFGIAIRAVDPHAAGAGAAAVARPYGAFSPAHLLELLNELLLVLPVPLFAGLAALLAGRAARGPALYVLAAAAAAGALAAVLLVLTAAPAVDWDLLSVLVLPVALLAIAAAAPWLAGERDPSVHAGLRLLGTGALLAFVLVNASEAAGLLRFKTLIGPKARITPAGRAYPNEILASYYEDRRDWTAALAHARLALAYEPTNPRYWVKVGAEYNRLGRFDKAVRALEGAVRRGPGRADAHYNLGLAYVFSGRVAEGITELRKAVALPGGDRPSFHHDLGAAYAAAGDTAAAHAEWSALLARWPGYAPTRRAVERRWGPERPAGRLVH
ncbi:MAG: tetratricopeptide repeat protein [Hyphomicrobiales bacterium]